MDKGCNGGVPCPDGLVRAGDQSFVRILEMSVEISETQFKGAGRGGSRT